jgi:transcriptional regulator with XRE-family HTH domain
MASMDKPNPGIWDEPEMRQVLAVRDVAGIFRLLQKREISQRRIAEMTGMSQSEVSEVLHGTRQVQAYNTLLRICEGLGAPRGLMGLAYDEPTEVALADEVDENMRRRALMATGAIALFGNAVLGAVLHIPTRPATPTPLPSWLQASDVQAIRSLTESLRSVTRTYGGGAEVMTGVASRSLALMSVPATDDVHAAMASALANLHTMTGWTCVDSGFHDAARSCFAKAMELAKEGDDNREMASAFRHAGIQMGEAGAYNDALKAFQLGLMAADRPETIAWLHGETSWPLAIMGHRDQAITALKKAGEQPLTDPFEVADMDYLSSCIYWKLGKLDTAQAFATSSVRKWEAEGVSKRDSVEADIVLATLHASTRQLDTVPLAQKAIGGVAGLQSVRARQVKLQPLVEALENQPGRSEFKDLAVYARKVMRTVQLLPA